MSVENNVYEVTKLLAEYKEGKGK
ncbi:hypothetical protein LD11_gp203 [Bacillus phage Riley]|uniref:Uncharacterized protein n=2 Tax=Bequatrovirus TaxID=1917990 RepID=A0A075M0E3_9CAUD|nr:hypothetical protein LD11_gp203 [Bacillus phage Riley]YP_009290080.1 hypothetical protein BI003_gp201 [Bacillus phage Phrodo]AIF72079.1 hypothetical protein [Bacillus phage Riley]AMW61655.1 hypothetical protein JUGLONE_206 [Bacillus phage Juglone]AMW62242.1 hypothetical protein PHRODO_201 [Bacillus phage Phrodo]